MKHLLTDQEMKFNGHTINGNTKKITLSPETGKIPDDENCYMANRTTNYKIFPYFIMNIPVSKYKFSGCLT